MARKREPCPHVEAGAKVFKKNKCFECFLAHASEREADKHGLLLEWLLSGRAAMLRQGRVYLPRERQIARLEHSRGLPLSAEALVAEGKFWKEDLEDIKKELASGDEKAKQSSG